MKIAFFAFLLFIIPNMFSQDKNQACPVSFPAIDLTGDALSPWHSSFVDSNPWGLNLAVELKNTAGKDIAAVQIGASFIDAAGHEQGSDVDYLSSSRLKPGKTHRYEWQDGVYISPSGESTNVRVWLMKAVYSDGSVWRDDGTHSCSGRTGATPIHKKS